MENEEKKDKKVNVYGRLMRKDDPLLGIDKAVESHFDTDEESESEQETTPADLQKLLELFLYIMKCFLKRG